MTTATIELPRTTAHRRLPADDELARAAGSGDVAAFEALYERHHLALLSFARHMLGRVHDAEDVVQHTFAAADTAFRAGRLPASVRAWLYTVARNRCISILRARRDDRELPDPGIASTENLADEVEQREDLRELLDDLRELPDDQRAALLLAELGELSHAEVAQVLGVRPRKVKALVYQARQALMSAAGARAIPCRSIREELAVASGAARRRRHLRDHVARCDGCRAYSERVTTQRASLAAILPVVPTVALRDGVLACLGAGGASAATAGAGAGVGVLGAKLLAIVAIGGAAAGGGAVAVTQLEQPEREPRAVRSAAPALDRAAERSVRPAPAAQRSAAPAPAAERARLEAVRSRAARATPKRAAAPAARGRSRAKPETPVGLAKRQARDKTPGGRVSTKRGPAAPKPRPAPQPPAAPAARPAPANAATPDRSQARKPPQTEAIAPAQAAPNATRAKGADAPLRTK